MENYFANMVTPGYFEIMSNKNGYWVRLCGGNNRIICTSEHYENIESGARDAIRALKNNAESAVTNPLSKNGYHFTTPQTVQNGSKVYYAIFWYNNEKMFVTEMYHDLQEANNSIARIRRIAPDAKIKE